MTREDFVSVVSGAIEPVRGRKALAAAEIVFFFVWIFGVAAGGAIVLDRLKDRVLADSGALVVQSVAGFWELSIPLLFIGILTAYPVVVALCTGLLALIFDCSVSYTDEAIVRDRAFSANEVHRWAELERADFAINERRITVGKTSSRAAAMPELTLHFASADLRVIDQLNFFGDLDHHLAILDVVARHAPGRLAVAAADAAVLALVGEEPAVRRDAIETLYQRALALSTR